MNIRLSMGFAIRLCYLASPERAKQQSRPGGGFAFLGGDHGRFNIDVYPARACSSDGAVLWLFMPSSAAILQEAA